MYREEMGSRQPESGDDGESLAPPRRHLGSKKQGNSDKQGQLKKENDALDLLIREKEEAFTKVPPGQTRLGKETLIADSEDRRVRRPSTDPYAQLLQKKLKRDPATKKTKTGVTGANRPNEPPPLPPIDIGTAENANAQPGAATTTTPLTLPTAETANTRPGAVAINGLGLESNPEDDSAAISYDEEEALRNVANSPNHVSGDIHIPVAELVPDNEQQQQEPVVHDTATLDTQKRRNKLLLLTLAVAVIAAITIGAVVGTQSGSGNPLGPCGNGTMGNGVCEDGLCCSENGFCGVTPEFCINGQVPPGNFTATGFCGMGDPGNGTCANSVLCCSNDGFCGSTAEFCVNGQEIPFPDGFCGDNIVGNGTCAGGLCCSPAGFCGVTAEFCVNGQTPP